jgi:hypothetical protein
MFYRGAARPNASPGKGRWIAVRQDGEVFDRGFAARSRVSLSGEASDWKNTSYSVGFWYCIRKFSVLK